MRRPPAPGPPHGGQDMAGLGGPLAQAEPADAHTPASSSSTTSASLSTPSKQQWALPGILVAATRSPPSRGRRPPTRRPDGRAARRRARRFRRAAPRRPARPPPSPRCRPRCGCRSAVRAPDLLRARWRAGPGRRPAPPGQHPYALGPAQFVGTDADEVVSRRGRGHVHPGGGLHRVGVQRRRGGPATDHVEHLLQRLDGAHLVVDQHHRHHGDIAGHRGGQRFEVDDAVGVDGNDPHLDPCGGRRGDHRVVLDGGGDHRPPAGGHRPQDGQVVGFGPPAGEDHAAWIDAHPSGDLVACVVDGRAGGAGHRVGPRRVTEALRQPGLHRGKRLGPQRRGCRVIEVGHHGLQRTEQSGWTFATKHDIARKWQFARSAVSLPRGAADKPACSPSPWHPSTLGLVAFSYNGSTAA